METAEKRRGPVAPKDPEKKRPFFFIMQGKDIYGAPQKDGRGIQFIYEDGGRLLDAARLTGNITDDYMIDLLKSTEGFRKMVHSIGVSVSGRDSDESVRFVMQMYPHNPGEESTEIIMDLPMDGMERVIDLGDVDFFEADKEIGQIRFEFAKSGIQASADVRFYLNDGFVAPIQSVDAMVDFESDGYKEMIKKSLMLKGNTGRITKLLQKAGSGEDVTLAFIGGSITQGAGAIPIHEKSYARNFADTFEKKFVKGGKVDLVKAGVGGTPSELGMVRFDRDILRDGTKKPDIIVIEFAVNDEGDETKGVCYESLVRKALELPWKPAVVLLFAVFSFDWNLQDRLGCVGERYNIPMVSIMDAVTPQFKLLPNDGRVISKNQFFYDQFHPTNAGHRIMSDCLINLIDVVNAGEGNDGEEVNVAATKPAIGADFETVKLLDIKEYPALKAEFGISNLSEGSFKDTDTNLQMVEMDREITPVPEFPYNWSHSGKTGNEPFEMDINCKRLLLLFQDSGSPSYGTCEVSIDGKKVYDANPLQVGWTHANSVIILNEEKSAKHHVSLKMAEGMEDKVFTILGFGIVK